MIRISHAIQHEELHARHRNLHRLLLWTIQFLFVLTPFMLYCCHNQTSLSERKHMISFIVREDYESWLKEIYLLLYLWLILTYGFMKTQYIQSPATIYLLNSIDNSIHSLCVFVTSIKKILNPRSPLIGLIISSAEL